MKIVHIVDYLMPTMGYQEFILPKFNAISKKNSVYILTGNSYYPIPNYNSTWKKFLGPRNFLPKKITIDCVKIFNNKILFEFAKRPWILNLERDIKYLKPDVIMCHGTASFSSIRSVLVAKKLNIPIFLDNHMIFSIVKNNIFGKLYYFFIKKFISKFIERNSNVIFGVTKETCQYLIQKEGYSKSKVKLLPLGTDSSIFYPKIKKNRNKIKIIQTGKLNFDKRPDFLAKATIILIEEGYNVELIYYGSGDINVVNKIKNLFKKKKITSRLKIIYNDADVVVFPFGTSLSAIDCAFCGIPVVMTDDMASKEKEQDGIGICYKTGDIKDLAKKIKICLNFKRKNKLFEKKRLNRIKRKYDYKVISDNFLSICKNEINKNLR